MIPLDFKSIGRSLRHRNFRLFFIGQGLSLVGTWMQQVAMSWLVYRLTHSAVLLGVVAFATQAPTFALSPYAGFLADRRNRHRMILLTQSFAMLQALVLFVLVATGTVTVPLILGVSLFMGIVNAFDVPARQSFIIETLDRRDDIGNALALHSTVFNSARLVGPSIAGVVIATMGEAPCFFLNTLSYVPILWALLAMRFPKKPAGEPRPSRPFWHELEEAFSFAFRHPSIRLALTMVTLGSLMGAPYSVLMPVFAKDVLGGGPRTLGFLIGASGFGALSAAITMAARPLPPPKWLLGNIARAGAVLGCGLMLFTLSRNGLLSAFLMWFVGFGMMMQMISANTLVQSSVGDDMRGRVMSLYTMAVIGMAPVGALIAGFLASRIGAPKTLFIGGFFCVAGAAGLFSELRNPRRLG